MQGERKNVRRTDRIKRKHQPILPIKKTPSKEVEERRQGNIRAARRGGFYDKHYKKLLIIPFIILLAAIATITAHYATTGDFINRGVSLKGGLLITVPTETVGADELGKALNTVFTDHDIETRSLEDQGRQIAITISADLATEDEQQVERFIKAIEQATETDRNDYSIETIGSSLGASFFAQTSKALFIAFIFMGLVVYLYFGTHFKVKVAAAVATVVAAAMMYSSSSTLNVIALLIGAGLIYTYIRYSIPSVAVILAAFSDIVVTLAVVDLLGIKISTAGIAAFLMLIGYSVDTDILLSTRMIKRKEGSLYDRLISAIKTGLTMNFTTMAAVLIALFFSESQVISEIMTVLFIGLLADMVNTWLQNAGILRWYLEKKEKEEGSA